MVAFSLVAGNAAAQGVIEKDLDYGPFELAGVTVEEARGAWDMSKRTQFVRRPFLSDVAKSIARSRGEAIAVVFANQLPGSVAYFGMPTEPMLRSLVHWNRNILHKNAWGYTITGDSGGDISYCAEFGLIHFFDAEFNEVLRALARAWGPKRFWIESGSYRNVSLREERVELGHALVQSARFAGASAFANTGSIGYIWQRRPLRVVAFNPAILDQVLPDQESHTYDSVADALDATLAENDIPFLAIGDLAKVVSLPSRNRPTVRVLLEAIAEAAKLEYRLMANGIILQPKVPTADSKN